MLSVKNTNNGVKAFLSGFKAEEIMIKVQECQDGNCSCACDPQMMQKIEGIEFSSVEGGSTITITGDVDAQTLAPMMQECLIGTTKKENRI